ncbi:MAG: diphosphate--fructose-6-phosphate 1-phosphotransferase [Desulfobacteraceae bacterium]|nr:diphosphate--fructose-6-phosphate 1-phosphotransferase [Desulfobacteraceae bacterium]
MTGTLKNKLIDMEKNRSPFECEIRKRNVLISKKFIKNNKVCPVLFESSGQKLDIHNDSVAASFKNVINDNNNEVLKAKGIMDEVSGRRIAVLFSGGPAAGGHNVLAGIKKVLGKGNKLFGIKAGPKGLLRGRLFEITDEAIENVLNLGGFDLLGSDRTKIKSKEQYEQVRKTVRDYNLDGIIIIGGDDSNTNAAFLAEYLYSDNCRVIGVPKTIDGDLQIDNLLPISFGFDTATRIYAELVGNILQDTPSSRKYWHFVKLMGRSASHVALEVALQTRATITIISEEVQASNITLNDMIEKIASIVAYRAGKGINHGVVVLPEGLIEFFPAFRKLISELNEAVSKAGDQLKGLSLMEKLALVSLSRESAQLLTSLPEAVENKLFMDRDSHGNLQVSQIPTEHLLIDMTEKKIAEMKKNPGAYFGPGKIDLNQEELARFYHFKFRTNDHFFGYEGRCGAPSNFDANYTFNLGLVAGSLILQGKTGYMASITELDKGGEPLAIPLTGLINVERRDGKDELVIKKALVKLDSPAFKFFSERRKEWWLKDAFTSPGPRQMWGVNADQIPFTVALNQNYDVLNFNIGTDKYKD